MKKNQILFQRKAIFRVVQLGSKRFNDFLKLEYLTLCMSRIFIKIIKYNHLEISRVFSKKFLMLHGR